MIALLVLYSVYMYVFILNVTTFHPTSYLTPPFYFLKNSSKLYEKNAIKHRSALDVDFLKNTIILS